MTRITALNASAATATPPRNWSSRIGFYLTLGLLSILIGYGLWYSPARMMTLLSTFSGGLAASLLTLGLLAQRRQKSIRELWARPTQESLSLQTAADIAWEANREGHLTALSGRLIPTNSDVIAALLGRPLLDIVTMEPDQRRKMHDAIRAERPFSDIQSLYQDSDGHLYYLSLSAAPKHNSEGDVTGYVGVATNITERVLNERRLKQLAENDSLTGLANRHRFNEQIRLDLSANTQTTCLALLAIDLDGFKQVNDTYGHQAGDALLNLVGKRLQSHVRGDDWAARLGGDEFMVVSRGIKNPMDACLMAARLITVLAQPYHVGGVELSITASIGIACAPAHAQSPTDLMEYADKALYQAKTEGRNRFSLYADEALEHTETTVPQLH